VPGSQECAICGTARDPGAPDSLVWGRERDADGRVHWICPGCARRHARDIEARLPHEWW
jgi:transposase